MNLLLVQNVDVSDKDRQLTHLKKAFSLLNKVDLAFTFPEILKRRAFYHPLLKHKLEIQFRLNNLIKSYKVQSDQDISCNKFHNTRQYYMIIKISTYKGSFDCLNRFYDYRYCLH